MGGKYIYPNTYVIRTNANETASFAFVVSGETFKQTLNIQPEAAKNVTIT